MAHAAAQITISVPADDVWKAITEESDLWVLLDSEVWDGDRYPEPRMYLASDGTTAIQCDFPDDIWEGTLVSRDDAIRRLRWIWNAASDTSAAATGQLLVTPTEQGCTVEIVEHGEATDEAAQAHQGYWAKWLDTLRWWVTFPRLVTGTPLPDRDAILALWDEDDPTRTEAEARKYDPASLERGVAVQMVSLVARARAAVQGIEAGEPFFESVLRNANATTPWVSALIDLERGRAQMRIANQGHDYETLRAAISSMTEVFFIDTDLAKPSIADLRLLLEALDELAALSWDFPIVNTYFGGTYAVTASDLNRFADAVAARAPIDAVPPARRTERSSSRGDSETTPVVSEEPTTTVWDLARAIDIQDLPENARNVVLDEMLLDIANQVEAEKTAATENPFTIPPLDDDGADDSEIDTGPTPEDYEADLLKRLGGSWTDPDEERPQDWLDWLGVTGAARTEMLLLASLDPARLERIARSTPDLAWPGALAAALFWQRRWRESREANPVNQGTVAFLMQLAWLTDYHLKADAGDPHDAYAALKCALDFGMVEWRDLDLTLLTLLELAEFDTSALRPVAPRGGPHLTRATWARLALHLLDHKAVWDWTPRSWFTAEGWARLQEASFDEEHLLDPRGTSAVDQYEVMTLAIGAARAATTEDGMNRFWFVKSFIAEPRIVQASDFERGILRARFQELVDAEVEMQQRFDPDWEGIVEVMPGAGIATYGEGFVFEPNPNWIEAAWLR